jgi:hypothetical protein
MEKVCHEHILETRDRDGATCHCQQKPETGEWIKLQAATETFNSDSKKVEFDQK